MFIQPGEKGECFPLFPPNDKDKNKDLVKVKIAEVAHSIFYAPQYVAIHNNYCDLVINLQKQCLYFTRYTEAFATPSASASSWLFT